MKTRTGFVSNSSSSSFIAMATTEAFEEALTKLENDNARKVLRVIAEDGICLGVKVKIVKEFSDAGGFSSIWGCDGDRMDEILEQAGVKAGEDEDDMYDDAYQSICDYSTALSMLVKNKEWKDKIYIGDAGSDGG
jgi:hypothetical protein